MTPEKIDETIRRGAEIARDVMLRDQFAMAALQGALARSGSMPGFIPGTEKGSDRHFAAFAYEVADAMLKARAK